jgi:hypothetical protein
MLLGITCAAKKPVFSSLLTYRQTTDFFQWLLYWTRR